MLVIIIIGISSIWVYRSQIMKMILIDAISERSGGEMVLSLAEIDYNPFEKSLKVFNLNLTVLPVDLINDKKTKLSQLSFDSVTVAGFSVWKLLKERKIKAREIHTAKPEIIFSHNEEQKKSKSSISSHLHSLHKNRAGLSIFPIEINLLKVEYGNVVFEADSTKEYLGSADFMVELHDFNTTVDSLEFDSHSFLYARRLIIDISDFLKPLKNDRELSIKNIRFDSKYDKLDVSSFYLSRGVGGVVDSIYINDVEIDGLSISEIKSANDLNIQLIKVNGGYLGLKPNLSKNSTKKEKTAEILEQIFPLIKQIDIDTVMFENINCALLRSDFKKSAIAEGVGFQFVGLSIDTSMYYNNIFPSFDLFEFGIEYFSFDSTQTIQTQNITYSSSNSQLKISNIAFADTLANIEFKSKEVLVDGLDVKGILDKKINHLKLTLTQPDVNVNLSSKYFKKSSNKKQSGFAELFKLEKIIVNQADITLFNNEGLMAIINKLNVSTGIYDRKIEGEDISRKSLTDLSWDSEKIEFSLEKNNLSYSSASSSCKNNYLNLKNGKLKIGKEGSSVETIDFSFHDLGISDFEILSLVENNSFNTKQIVIKKPIIDVSLSVIDSLNKKQSTDSLFIALPFNIEVDELVLRDGDFEISVNKQGQLTSFTTGFELNVDRIMFPKYISFNEIQQIGLSIELESLMFEENNIKANIEDLTFSTSDSSINLHNLGVDIDSLTVKNISLSTDKFSIENISLLKLDYLKAINYQELVFDKLIISKPEIDLSAHETENPNNKENSDKTKSNVLSKTSFNEIELSDLSLNLNLITNGLEKDISVGDFDIVWKPQKSSDNLLSELDLNISDFDLFNHENQSRIKLGHVSTSQLNNDLEFSELIIDKPLTANANGVYARVPSLSFKNIVHNNQKSYKIEVDELRSDTLFLEFNNRESEHKQLSFSGRVEALEEYSDIIKRFNIKKSIFKNVDLRVNNISDSTHNEYIINEMDIYASDAGFSSSDSSMLHLSNIKLDINNRKFITADSLYEISSGDILYDFSKSSISVDSFKLKPRFASEEFFKKAVNQTTMLDVTGNKIVLAGIDFQRVISKKEFLVSSVDLDGFNLIAYRDKKYPFKHGTEKPFPSEAIRGVKSNFYIDTLRLNNSHILVGEYVAGSVIPGEIFFTDVNIMGRELSNMPSLMTFPPIIKVDFNSKVMGNTNLTANIEFPLNTNGFSFSGKTEEIDFRDFNSMTQNLFGVSITKGKGNLDIIGINAGDSIATGSLIFRYKKLRVRLYDREKAQLNKGIAAPFFSFLVNDLLVKSNNPHFLGKTRTGHVYIEPNKEKVFINYIWKGILSGIMSTMWLNSKEQRKEKKRMNELAK